MKTVICDIDGTLADCRHRLHHVLPGAKRDWDAFFAAQADDGVIEPVADIVRTLDTHYGLVLCSGRPENYRAVTEAWLLVNGIPYDALYMRPAGDTRADHIVKAQLLAGMREDGFEPFIVIDDRQSVVDMWRDAGLICLQCAPAEHAIPASAVLTVMVGPSGAGKTAWLTSDAALDMGIRAAHVISSDQIREDMCGDFRDQTRNAEVFAAVHSLARARLKLGLPTVIDATNLRRKDRMTCAALADGNPVRYVVIDRPMHEKIATGGWRNDVTHADGVPYHLIARHSMTFTSQIKDILRGDGLPNVTVYDWRMSNPALRLAA